MLRLFQNHLKAHVLTTSGKNEETLFDIPQAEYDDIRFSCALAIINVQK